MKYWRVEIERRDGQVRTYWAEGKTRSHRVLYLDKVYTSNGTKVADEVDIVLGGVAEIRYRQVERIGA